MDFRKIIFLIIAVCLISCKKKVNNTEVNKTLDSLPFSESIIYTIDSFKETSSISFEMKGWAFVDSANVNEKTEYYLAIQKNKLYDLFKLDNVIRNDVTNHFKKSKDLELDYSGFKIHFKHDEYTFKNEVGLYIYYPDIQKGYAVLINNSLNQF